MSLPRSLLAAIDRAVLDPAVDDGDEVVDDLVDEWDQDADQPPARRRRTRETRGVGDE